VDRLIKAAVVRVLCLNCGSSSLKAAGFVAATPGDDPERVVSEAVDRIGPGDAAAPGHVAAFAQVADELERAGFAPDVVAHRIVHGGPALCEHVVVDGEVRAVLSDALEFAPLHLPASLAVLDAASARFPGCVHVACLDTAFHRDLAPAARRLPIPAEYDAAGVRRYGFHGLSFEYLVHRLGGALGHRAVLAHLGNGASLAAVRDGVGVDTTMGLTPAGGLVMGTRTGDLDPGVLVHLARTRGLDPAALEHVVDEQSGLLGVSGRSGDVRELLAARAGGDERAGLALEIFETTAAKHVAALTTVLGGLDTLVFTAGVGEHATETRAGICGRLAHVGVVVDHDANAANAAIVSPPGAPVTVRVEPTDEEVVMARHAARLATG
jgi:acetate kinase